MIMISIKRIILSLSKEEVNVYDLGYLGLEKDFSKQKSSLPHKKKRNLEISTKEEKEHNNIIH